MKVILQRLWSRIRGSRMLFAAVLILYIALAGPILISADNTFSVVLGIVLALLIGLWAWSLFLYIKEIK